MLTLSRLMRILLLTPPMTQINTPYPATAYLTAFLRQRGYDARQADPAIELFHRLYSRSGLERVLGEIRKRFPGNLRSATASVRFFLQEEERYLRTVGRVVRFLQGRDPTLAYRLVTREFIPEGPRFAPLKSWERQEGEGLHWAFGALGLQDRAQHLASLYVDDIADAIREGVDGRFELSRYAEKLAASAPSFDPLRSSLFDSPTLVDQLLDEITDSYMKTSEPDVVGMSVPFPGNVYGAFRMAKRIRESYPEAKLVLGGGYVNTELRDLKDPRLFDFFDFVTFDDGEAPLWHILRFLEGKAEKTHLLRTLVRENGIPTRVSHPDLCDVPFSETPAPSYVGLPLDRYLSLCEMLNPMHRLWSDGRWNKLTLAHGCYWRQCSFCDTTLDYIGRYEQQEAHRLVDKIEQLVSETAQTGFHFVDEAAPPKMLVALANALLERGTSITWWGNIRFEKTFTREVASLLARSGCIAVSGGLEVASDRLLKKMNKGVTVEQVARVTRAFSEAHVMVHAYLMYGFPTQTVQETVDALERVRQLFASGCIQSAFWHRFSATAHSPIGKDPGHFGIQLRPLESSFARNDLPFVDPTGVDHDSLAFGLKKALYNYMLGVGFEKDVRFWFDFAVPKARVPRHLIEAALREASSLDKQCRSS